MIICKFKSLAAIGGKGEGFWGHTISVHVRLIRASSEDRGKPSPYYTRAWQADASSIVGAYACGRLRGWAYFVLCTPGF